jgi:predicted Zn-dependent protease
MLTGISVSAELSDDVAETVNMKNFWERNGVYEQKVLDVGEHILNANKIPKRVAINTNRNRNVINATSYLSSKTVVVYYGILPYIDNDDELAAVISHEIVHAMDAYDGPLKWAAMKINGKAYETKADLMGIDLMVKAGYNPIAAICVQNKAFPETYHIWLKSTHPDTSVRLMSMYKYIYVKYPWALKTDMTNNVSYQNFLYSSEKERNEFVQHEKEHKNAQKYIDGDL